jgi:hypothetical protein
MHYSLVNRVRGIFLGALLGEILANQNACDLGELAVLGSQSLIRLGRLDGDDWLNIYQNTCQNIYQQTSVDLRTSNIPWGKTIVATLPVAIFFHEDTVKLKDNLQHLLKLWQTEPAVIDAALVMGYAITKCLTETLDPVEFIPQTISFLGETTTHIPQKLLKVNNLLAQGIGLEQVRTEFNRPEQPGNPIALAFYCFLSSLEDFPLTVLRANSSSLQAHSSSLTGALAGALSGAYNSTIGIPAHWQTLFSASNPPVWGMKSFSQILELADILVTVWSGEYNISSQSQELTKAGSDINWELTPLSIFAAPRVIRPR